MPSSAKGAPPPPKSARTPKTFTVAPWTGRGEGLKVVGYGKSGSGKTTLFSMMPEARFIGLDDGGRLLRNPRTGEPLNRVLGVETLNDYRDALAQDDLWPKGSSCVTDTVTVLENLAEPWMFANIKGPKGVTVANLEGYGYGKGYTHLFDTMRMVLQDLDRLIRRGVNVGLVCQSMAIKQANAAGADFLYDGPKLSHPGTNEKTSVRLHVCEWADEVFKIDHLNVQIEAEDKKIGKAIGDTTRAIFTQPEPHYFAKTRTLTEPVIAFNSPDDDSLWRYLFPEAYANDGQG